MFKNGLYNLFGTIARLALSILSVPLLLKFLGSSIYGLYMILLAIINIAILSEWSICMVLIVFIAQAKIESSDQDISLGSTLKHALVLVIGLAVITSSLLWILSPWLGLAFPNLSNPDKILLQKGCNIAAITVLFRLLQQYFVGIEQAHGHYKLLNSINTLFNITQTFFILVAAYLGKSLLSLISIQAVITAIFLGIHGYCCYQKQWLKPLQHAEKGQGKQFRRMLLYSSRTFIGGIGSAFFSQGDRLVVGRLLGLEAVGFYSALTSVATQIHSLSTMAIQPLVPTLTKLFLEDYSPMTSTYETVKITVSHALKFNAILAAGLGSFIVMLAPEISIFLFKDKLPVMFEASTALKITTLIYTLYSLNAVGYYMLLAVKREINTTIISIICGPISLLMIGILAHLYGVVGALAGNAGYLLTLYMIVWGFKSFQLHWTLWLNALWQPLLVFILLLYISTLQNAVYNRIVILAIALFIMAIPLLKTGWQYLTGIRRNRNS